MMVSCASATLHGSEIAVICIVDDDAWARSGLEDLILSLGYCARSFESVERFVDSEVVAQTTCVITDLHMPGMDGLALQSRLRSEGRTIPVIFVTAYPSEAHRTRAFAEGAIGFLTKPCDEHSLVNCLRRAVPAIH